MSVFSNIGSKLSSRITSVVVNRKPGTVTAVPIQPVVVTQPPVRFSLASNDDRKGSLFLMHKDDTGYEMVYFYVDEGFYADSPEHTFAERIVFEKYLKAEALLWWNGTDGNIECVNARRISYPYRYRNIIARSKAVK
jgi:hypothetical protein